MHTQNIILPWVFIVPGNEKLAAAWAANTWYQISYEKICISIAPLLGTRDNVSAVENPRPSRETRRCEGGSDRHLFGGRPPICLRYVGLGVPGTSRLAIYLAIECVADGNYLQVETCFRENH